MAMLDPVAIILRAGGLTLRELFARVGNDQATRRRIAVLIKQGDLRLAASDAPESPDVASELGKISGKSDLSEVEISDWLAANTTGVVADTVEIAPTSRAWRRLGSSPAPL